MAQKGTIWTPEQDELLKQKVVKGGSLTSLARDLGRTEKSIRARAHYLKLPLRTLGLRRGGMAKYG